MKAEPFLQLDRVIHEKGRLGIMSALAASPEMAFTELRDLLSELETASGRDLSAWTREWLQTSGVSS